MDNEIPITTQDMKHHQVGTMLEGKLEA